MAQITNWPPPIKKTPRLSGTRLSPEDFARIGLPETVYVRAVRAGEVIGENGWPLPLTSTLYAVYAADGAPMALMASREFSLRRSPRPRSDSPQRPLTAGWEADGSLSSA